ncbi:MAG TPA: hypothetical protein VHX38_09880 [Pseudonocardiaceae bacterium]|jgi:hypothetical protein|nr:hypothetical protein [Pseudonocardiaceae bacterium]
MVARRQRLWGQKLWRRRLTSGPEVGGRGGAEARLRARLEFMQGEYNSIRTELVAAVSSQQVVMTYALAAIAVIFSGLLSAWSNFAVRIGILSLAPLILLFIWFVWFGEALRLIRARWFIWELEKKINSEFGDDAGIVRTAQDAGTTRGGRSSLRPGDTLHWEAWVRGHNRWGRNLHSRPSYQLATGILCGTGLASTVLALVGVFATPGSAVGLRALAIGAGAVFSGLLGLSAVTTLRNPLVRTQHLLGLPAGVTG